MPLPTMVLAIQANGKHGISKTNTKSDGWQQVNLRIYRNIKSNTSSAARSTSKIISEK